MAFTLNHSFNYLFIKMNLLKKSCFLFFLFSLSISTAFSQQNNCGLRISLLTATPGEELYSTFGHSAIRVTDSMQGTDIIFNYGTFDFDDPDFYSKFVRGKLLYFVSVDDFENFVYQYQYEKRGITEQELNLTCNEKNNLYNALIENSKEENKYYKYDFVYDNCTTRLRDIVEKETNEKLVTKNIRPYEGVSFRNLIHEYLDRGNQYWSKFGIDMVLGTPLDKEITNQEAMFLPDYLLYAFDSTTKNGKPLVQQKKELIPPLIDYGNKPIFTPLVIFTILMLLVLIASFMTNKKIQAILTIFDFIFFLVCGLIGVLILFMWFGTEHQTAKNNFNIWWALPLHAVMAFMVHKRNSLVKKYFTFIFFSILLLLGAWVFLPQQLNIAFLPVVGIILIRSWFISKKDFYGIQPN